MTSEEEPLSPVTSLQTKVRVAGGRPTFETPDLANPLPASGQDLIDEPAMGSQVVAGPIVAVG